MIWVMGCGTTMRARPSSQLLGPWSYALEPQVSMMNIYYKEGFHAAGIWNCTL